MIDSLLGIKKQFSCQITQSDIDTHIELSSDTNPFHISKEYSISEGFQDVIVHGMILSSKASYIPGVLMELKGMVLIEQNCQFINPVFVNDICIFEGEIKKADKRFKCVEIEVVISVNKIRVGKAIFKMKLK
jgi:acyl dehydratase